jgi:subtilisin family serine protease
MKRSDFLRGFQYIAAIAILSQIFYSCNKEFSEPLNERLQDVSAKTESSAVIEGRYVVILSDEPAVKNQQAAAVLEEIAARVSRMAGAKVRKQFVNTLTGFVADLTENQVADLKRDRRILAIESDRPMSFDAINTVQEDVAWGLDRIDQQEAKLNRAYTYNATGKGINAYIMDSGIRFSHEEFHGRAILGYDVGYELYPEKRNPDIEQGVDCIGHGTHVAGIVGGKLFGVAKEVQLISVKLSSGCEYSFSWSDVIAATDWIAGDVVENNRLPAVVNMSIGGRPGEGIDYLQIAIDNAIQKGIHFVVSAGNANTEACEFIPAKYPGVITVGATEIGDNRSVFSNYGSCIDLFAPGTAILSASVQDDKSSVIKSGTSMSSPNVAGIVALFLEENPKATPAEVQKAIISNATPNAVKNVPSGTASLANSLWKSFSFTPPSPPALVFKVVGKKVGRSSTTVQFTWEPTNDPLIEIYRNGSLFYWGKNNGLYTTTMNLKSNEVFRLCEKNYINCSPDIPVDYNGEILVNLAPIADFSYEVDDLKVTFTNLSTDPDGTIINQTWYFGDGYASNAVNPIYTYKEAGVFTVTLYVGDNYDSYSNTSKIITVGNNEALPDIVLNARGYKVSGKWHTDLSWDPIKISSETVEVYLDPWTKIYVPNTGKYTHATEKKGSGSMTYKICLPNSTFYCSNEVTVIF